MLIRFQHSTSLLLFTSSKLLDSASIARSPCLYQERSVVCLKCMLERFPFSGNFYGFSPGILAAARASFFFPKVPTYSSDCYISNKVSNVTVQLHAIIMHILFCRLSTFSQLQRASSTLVSFAATGSMMAGSGLGKSAIWPDKQQD